MKRITCKLTHAILAFLLVFLVASCDKDATDGLPPVVENNTNTPQPGMQKMNLSMDDPESGLCFDFVYPVTIILPDNSEITGNSMDELETALDNWYAQHPNSNEDPTLAYPVDVVKEDGTIQTLQSDEDLFVMLEFCDWDDEFEWETCFEIQYPINLIYPDGSSDEVNSDQELGQLLAAWEMANPNSDEFPTFEFPFTVEYDDELILVQDESSIEALFEACFAGDWDDVDLEFSDCFEFVFPIEIEMPDGTILTANNYEELDEIFISWFEDPDPSGFPTFVYPFSVVIDDEIVVIEDEDTLDEVLENCYDDSMFEDCFTFNFPLTILFPDGTSTTVADLDELQTVIIDWYDQNPMSDEDPVLEFPVEVTLEDGTVVTLDNEEELEDLLEDCFECVVTNGDGLVTGIRNSKSAALMLENHADIEKNRRENISRAFRK